MYRTDELAAGRASYSQNLLGPDMAQVRRKGTPARTPTGGTVAAFEDLQEYAARGRQMSKPLVGEEAGKTIVLADWEWRIDWDADVKPGDQLSVAGSVWNVHDVEDKRSEALCCTVYARRVR